MRVGVFSAKGYDKSSLGEANARAGSAHELVFLEARLVRETAPLGAGFPVVCAFVNDRLDAEVLPTLARGGTRFVALRCAGFNNLDLEAARRLGERECLERAMVDAFVRRQIEVANERVRDLREARARSAEDPRLARLWQLRRAGLSLGQAFEEIERS